jgi:myo-inositol-1(or 4)-monophosphatase
MDHERIPSPQFLEQVLRVAGTRIRQELPHPGTYAGTLKLDGTLVTPTDEAAERLICEAVAGEFPHLQIISEEGHSSSGTGPVFICDPLDGSALFAAGETRVVTQCAVVVKQVPATAVIHDPFTGRMFTASNGRSTCDGRPLSVREGSRSKWKRVAIGAWPESPVTGLFTISQKLEDLGYWVETTGSVGYCHTQVASGAVAGCIFPGPHVWDTAPGHALVENAGGICTDMRGHALRYESSRIEGHIFAQDEETHALLLDLIKQLSRRR